MKESHARLGCALGMLQYIKNAQLIGVTAPAIAKTFKELKNSCAGCLQQHVFFNAKSPYSQQILQEHGLDDLVSTTVSQSPLSHVILDETGPIFFGKGDSEENELY